MIMTKRQQTALASEIGLESSNQFAGYSFSLRSAHVARHVDSAVL